jgi:septal ring factor EnvC (AmiA/AmiB activator)
MEDRNKNIVIFVLAIVCVFLFVILLNTYVASRKEKFAFFEEKALRWDLEQKAKELTNGRKALEEKLDAALKSLETEKTLHAAAKKSAGELQATVDALKEDLKKMTQEKEALEKQLSEIPPQAAAAIPGTK